MLKKLKDKTKNEKLKQIREAVDIALEVQGLESTRALVFGCVIKPYNCTNDKRKKIPTETVVTVEKYQGLGGRNALAVFTRETQKEESYDVCDDGTKIYRSRHTDGYFEIIGRDINWEDLIVVFGNRIGNDDRIDDLMHGMTSSWKPKVPLHLQGPFTIDFIYDLIVNNK